MNSLLILSSPTSPQNRQQKKVEVLFQHLTKTLISPPNILDTFTHHHIYLQSMQIHRYQSE